jgi:DNA topoisomerase-3
LTVEHEQATDHRGKAFRRAGHRPCAGRLHRAGDYFESDDYVLSSAVGHLLELAVPEEYDVKRGKWSFAHLPVIPPHFALNPIEKTQDRLKLLTRLIKRKDVTGLVNACDAGREGELIFLHRPARLGDEQKPVRRLWLQSMTAQAIRDGFAHLRAAQEMQPLRTPRAAAPKPTG